MLIILKLINKMVIKKNNTENKTFELYVVVIFFFTQANLHNK